MPAGGLGEETVGGRVTRPYNVKRHQARASGAKRRRWMELARARTLALENIENDTTGEPNYGSHVVLSVHRLCKKPIGEFSIEELRLMIGQSLGLPWLVPLAIEQLDENPFAHGDFYPGDLLSSVLGTLDDYVRVDGRCLGDVVRVARRARVMIALSAASAASATTWKPDETGIHDEAPKCLVRAIDEVLANRGHATPSE